MERSRSRSAASPSPVTTNPGGRRLHLGRNGFLYAGAIDDTTTQRNSVVLCVALTGHPFTVHTRRESLAVTDAVLVAPGWLRIDTCGAPVALLDVCPTDYHFRALARAVVGTRVWPCAHFAELFDDLASFRSGRMPRGEADALHVRVLELAMQRVPPVPPLDPRIRQVMRRMREEPGLPVADLAAAVDLSADWLRRLFAAEAGLPLGRYEMTLRLQTAAAHLHLGVSLTQVAANAGFADLAHFSKFWKLHYGFAPRRAFAGSEVVIDEVPWPCMETTHPGTEQRASPGWARLSAEAP
ncbi:hypothetical protein CPZ87_03270 [Piscinibacter gummiphilus]|uniref:helix-turn-helix domain-containing protein n=1 Tax=Piscinibacter gummiphilus TaxID=946333 RepID=UPI000A271E64|nr:helix-turn-helix domain-containing protein [Piscinibacter gummiphilus]ATU63648.1 hypothetical protein CPZ87_03270 [Piscinibacter gummiphilus]